MRLLTPLKFQQVALILLVVVSGLLGSAVLIVWNQNSALKEQVTSLEKRAQTLAKAPNKLAEQSTEHVAKLPGVQANEHIFGNVNAPIVIVEYSDLECPFCKQFQPELQQLVDQYKGQVAWVYRHFPLPFHANAQKEAEASECVVQLGGEQQFWKFITLIYQRTTSNGTGFALSGLAPLAQEIGLDHTQFTQCLDSGRTTVQVKDQAHGGEDSGVQGTPSVFILNKKGSHKFIVGAVPISQLQEAIALLLK